jgi:hypothetical protein
MGFEPRVVWTCKLKALWLGEGEIHGGKFGYVTGTGGNNGSAGESLEDVWTSIIWT